MPCLAILGLSGGEIILLLFVLCILAALLVGLIGAVVLIVWAIKRGNADNRGAGAPPVQSRKG